MILRFPGIEQDFDCDSNEYINTVVIENPNLLCKLLLDIESQLQGNDGKTVLCENNKILPIDKYLELHSCFIPFNINQKGLVNKITKRLNENAIDPDHYLKSTEIVSELERYGMELSLGLVGNIEFTNLSIDNLIKSIGPSIVDDYDSLSEKLLDYFELVREYDRGKTFVLLNLRSFLHQGDLQCFVDEILMRGYQVILMESREYPQLEKERRYVVDESLCEIC